MAGESSSCSSSSSSSSSSPNKRRRRVDDYAVQSSSCRLPRKRHLYLALDDWKGGYSIHKIDADDILYQEPAAARGKHRLPEPAALRIASPVPGRSGPMAFVALGTNIFIDTNQLVRGDRAAPTLVYDTKTSSLTGVGPRVPDWIRDLSHAMAAGERLYALTSPPDTRPSLHALSWKPINFQHGERRYPWQPHMEWTWNALPEMALYYYYDETEVSAYALHPDGRTIFMSSSSSTCSLDTSTGAWKELGDWGLPFRGQTYFDADLDAWVGLHRSRYGHVCCCPVVSRSSARQQPPGCQMLLDKLARRRKEDPTTHLPLLRPGEKTSLTYMGDSRYALFENILRGKDSDDGAVLHVTLFGLKYGHNGELRTKVLRSTRSYAVSKNTDRFSHAAFYL